MKKIQVLTSRHLFLLLGLYFIACFFVFNGQYHRKAEAFTVTDTQMETILSGPLGCGGVAVGDKNQTVHVVYIDASSITQNNNSASVTFFLHARSLRCPTAPSTATGVSNTLTSFTGPGVGLPGPVTFYTGQSLPRGTFSIIGFSGPYTITGMNVGDNTYNYTYRVSSFSSSTATGSGSMTLTIVDICSNLPGIQYPSAPPGYSVSGTICTLPPPNNPPTGSITASCTLVGATPTVNFSINTSDPEGDPVSITSLSVGGVAQAVGTRSVTVAFGASGSVVAVITDGVNAGVTLSAGYSCPNNRPPTGTVAISCTTLDITGTAVDPDLPGAVTVNILIDGFNVTGSGLVASPPGRTYSYHIATPFLDNAPHAVAVQASDYTGTGVLIGFVTIANSSFHCGTPSGSVTIACLVTGTVIDPSSPLTRLFVDATIDGTSFPNIGYTDPLDSGKLRDAITGEDKISLFAFLSDYRTHSVTITVKGVSPSGTPDGDNGVWGPVTVGPCAPTCDSNATQPALPQAGQSFSLSSLRWNYLQNSAVGASIGDWRPYTVSVSMPGIPFTDGSVQGRMDFPTVGNGGVGNLGSGATVGPTSAPNAGTYRVVMRIAGPQFTLVCDSDAVGRTVTGSGVPYTITEHWNPVKVANRPYIKVFGGDVSAGGGFRNAAGTCVAPTSKGILAWGLSNTGTGWTGSSVEYAAFAIDAIDGITPGYGFYSGSQTHSGGAVTPYGAYTTFANTGVPVLGGNFDNPTGHCMPDFYNSTRLTAVPTPLNSAVQHDVCNEVAIASATQYLATGTLTLNGCANFNKRVTIYVPGDVVVRGDITYAPYIATSATPSTLPYLTIVALGNVYIDAGVRNIDGLYIAQPNGAVGGTIHTCTIGGALIAHASLYNSCRTQLNVRGSLVARYVAMERTIGTVNSATTTENATTNGAAEVTIQGPEAFIGTPLFKPTTSSIFDSKPGFQSITSLSPLF
jgi:hypothetical protein